VLSKALEIAEDWHFMLNSRFGINGFGRRMGPGARSKIKGHFGFSDGNTPDLSSLQDALRDQGGISA
jgi:hypothetical protein